MCLFFFFQAEDGIRDATVTGVQTCALPISWRRSGTAAAAPPDRRARDTDTEAAPLGFGAALSRLSEAVRAGAVRAGAVRAGLDDLPLDRGGRAVGGAGGR